MYGAVASMLLLQQGGYMPVGGDALAYADFVEGIYELDGAASTLEDMFSGTDPGGFSGSGMKVAFANSNRPAATAALRTIIGDGLAGGITLLFEMQMATAAAGGPLMGVNDPDYTEAIEVNSQPGASDYGDLNFGTNTLSLNKPGTNRYAFTLSRDLGGGSYRNAVSVNGSAIVTNIAHYQNLTYPLADRFITPGIAAVTLGEIADWGYQNENEFFRKFAVYGPMTDSELVTLSSL
jgi:hypothetical protein